VEPLLVNACIELHDAVSSKFLPSSKKFHYQFNLRDLSGIFNGLCLADAKNFTAPMYVDLWEHEVTRVFADRMIEPGRWGTTALVTLICVFCTLRTQISRSMCIFTTLQLI
jgi:hypothetical protein